LEALAHAAETLMGKFRDGVPATNDSVTLILATIDRIKQILDKPRGAVPPSRCSAANRFCFCGNERVRCAPLYRIFKQPISQRSADHIVGGAGYAVG
jgi:hypothetical protein